MKYHGISAPIIPEDDKARFYLNLSEANGDQVELVAKEQDELRENGIPPMMTRELDNKYTTTTPNPDAGITRVITENPYTAAYFQGDQMNLWNKVAKEMRPLLPYDPKAEYSNGIDFEERKRVQAEERKRLLSEGDETAKQNAVMRDMMARFGDWRSRDDSTLRYWLNTSGKATGIDTSGWDVEDFRKRAGLGSVDWEKAVDLFGWQETQDAYRMLFHPEYRPQNLVDLDESAPAYLLLARKRMLEDENKMLRGNEWTVDVLNSVLQSVPLMTEMALTGGESAAVRSFMERGYKEAYRQGGVKLVSKMLAKGLGGAMTNGLKRLPFYAPKAAAEAYTDNYIGGFATMPDGEGGVSLEVNDLDSSNFFEGFVSHLLQSYAEVASEELGGLVPFGNVDATVLSRLVPKRLRNAFVSKIAWNPMTRRAFGKHILGNLPFHGFIGEFAEEELGNVMSFMATELMQLLGAKEQNTPQTESLLMGAGETGETAASIMLQTLLFRGLAGTVNTWRPGGAAYALKNVSRANRESKQFDAAATTVGQSRIGQASVPEARKVLNGIRGGDDTIGITPESAENILLQATEGKSDEEADGARETLAQAGITPESIAQARKDGKDLMLSSNTLLALAGNKKFKNAWDLVHKIRENMVSEVFGKTTKEITADGFTKEQIDEMVDRSKRQEDFLLDVQKTMSEAIRTAQKNAIAAGNKLGISQQNVQDFVNIYKWMANYLAENVETEEGLAKLKEMVDNLSVQFAESPEKFDTTAAVSGVAQARVASLERRVADIQSSIDALNSMDYLNDTQISQLETLKVDLEEAQNELEAAKNGALNQVSPVWTGSAASYEQPSLQYVGTGEGAQVYGWGLYGSSRRSVAEWYAKADADRKNGVRFDIFEAAYRQGMERIKFDGVIVDMLKRDLDKSFLVHVVDAYAEVVSYFSEKTHQKKMSADEIRKEVSLQLEKTIARYKKLNANNHSFDNMEDDYLLSLERAKENVDNGAVEFEDTVRLEKPQATRNLYKQTFWPDKEENLLRWEYAVSPGQMDAIEAAAKREGFEIPRLRDGNAINDLQVTQDREGEFTLELWLEHISDETVMVIIDGDGNIISADDEWVPEGAKKLSDVIGKDGAQRILDSIQEHVVMHPLQTDFGVLYAPYEGLYFGVDGNPSGERVYHYLAETLGSPKAASEFLYRAGIDGVTYIGDSSGARNYVAFSDKDIRVDEHILFQTAPSVSAVTNQLNALKDASSMTKEVAAADNGMADSEEVTDEETLSWLNSLSEDAKDEDKRLVRSTRWMQLIDGELYPVMNEKVAASKSAARVPATRLGAWTKAAEHPEKAFWTDSNESTDAKRNRHYWQEGVSLEKQNPKGHTWWFELSKTTVDKDGKEGVSSVVAKYAPFNHSSEEDFINDQFTIGYKRPNVVLVEGVFPLYELNHPSGDSLGMSDKKTGRHPWNHKKTLAQLGPHNVTLTKYFKAERILSPKEAAEKMAGMFKDHPDVTVTWNVIPPPILKELLNTKIPGTDKYVQFMEATGLSKAEVQRLADTGYLDDLRRRETPLWKNKEGTDVLYEGNTILKGQINLARFAQSQEAIISLFKDADASTLPHESAHWLKAAMESLVGAGFATDKMKQDLDTINAWLDKQDYTGAVTDQDKYRAREEYFARAFEQYLREGRFPEAATTGLKSALRRLARMLQSIYRNALALNAPIDDSIRGFFDDIFAVEEVVDGTSVLSGILREINTGALAFSKEDLKKLETAVAGAREDAETEAWLAALQDYQKGLREQQKLWRNEAKEAYAASKAEQAYTYVRNGHKLDENFLRNVLKLDEETISILKKKRLTYNVAPVETPVEAPVVAETAAPAVEPAPAETPASTASAEAPAATPLDGTPEQFDALGEDTTISLPEGEEAAQNAVANLVYGPDGKGGAIWKRIKVNPTGAELGDVLYKLYTVALNRLSEPAPVTKAGLIGYLSRTAFNTEQQAFRDQQKAPESMDETVFEGKDGDGASRYDVTGRTDFGFTSGDSEAYLTALSDFTETLADGTLKREIADIIYELSDAGEQATNEAIMAEYRQRGGTRQKTSLYDAIKEVRRSIRDYMQENGFLQSLDVETPASILDTMKELDYGDVNDLITDLKTAIGRSAFIKDYMNRKHAEYRNAFLDNPNWASEAGATRYLDAILRALKVTEGMKFSERARIAASEATRELMASASVRDVMNGERGVATSLRSNAAKVLRALKSGKEDKAAAITAALDMYRNDARLRAIRKLRADIQKTLNRAKRIGKSKPGSTLDGDTINAVKALLNRFGMSSAEPRWTTGPGDPQSVLAVMKEFTPDLETELTHWSPWMNRVLTGEEAKTSWQNLTPEQFYELTDLIDYLRGEGRQSLMDQKGTFASNLKTAMEAILPSVEEHKTGDYTDPADKTMLQKLGSLARSGIHQMKTLVFMAHLLDGRTEFYGDHVIGPVRKFFQLPLSEGASRELFWYQKTSKEIMPHLQALMRSAKERNLLFAVNNPNNRSYTELRGETAAFVLLNAGAVENRQRLMESFGWSEDELNGLLAQFTKEDFEHAEAIWKSLNEMGQELAKVYYRERHYRMPWATPSPISLTLNDGTEILSEGGYYPIAYTYHDSTQGYDPDIMNPFTKPNKPSRPTATFGRTPVLSDLSLLMSPAVVDRSIRENAHYIGMWEPLRMANAIWTSKDFKQAVIRNFSKETYDALKQLMDNVNNPDKGDKGLWKQVANKLGACLATTALGFKITTMAKQYASVTIGAERLGDYFHDAVSFALRDLKGLRRFVNEESPFMRDRYNLMDRDLRVVNTEFKKPIAKAADKYRYAAFWGLKQNDLNVAAVQWYAAFNWALDPQRGMTKDQARAYADDFVASTQGAARTVDTPVVQLETLGRLMTPFFGPACAAANTRLAGLSVLKQMDAGERIVFAVDNFLVPGLVMTLVAAVRGGLLNPDDDDDWDRIRKQSLIALLTEPVSGLPVVQDIADSVVRAAVTGRPVQSGVFEVSLFRPAEDVSREFVNMFRYWNELGYTTYAAASITGMLFGMPVVQVYEDYEKMILWNFGDKSSKPIKKQLQGEKRK